MSQRYFGVAQYHFWVYLKYALFNVNLQTTSVFIVWFVGIIVLYPRYNNNILTTDSFAIGATCD